VDLYTASKKEVWYESIVYATSEAYNVLDAFASWQQSKDPRASIILVFTLSAVVVGLVYPEPVQRPPVFSPFYNVPAIANPIPPTNGSVLDLINVTGGGASLEPARHDYHTASSKVDAGLYKQVYDFWVEQLTPVQEATGANMTFVLQHIPKSLVDIGNARGGNPIGLQPTDQQCKHPSTLRCVCKITIY
jgi:hypothetical protein